MKHFYTYIHRKASDGLVFYVGKGVGKRAWDCNRRNPKWKSIVAKHSHVVEVCAAWKNSEEAFQHEKFLIWCFKDMGCNLANLTDGGDGPHGYKYTIEQKAKMSLRRVGYKHSEETKRKMSLSQKGIPRGLMSDDAKIKMSASHKGRVHRPMSDAAKKKLSENNGSKRSDVRAKISSSLIGRKLSPERRLQLTSCRKGIPQTEEHKEKIRLARLAYFEKQRKMNGKAQTISEEHKLALKKGYNKHFGIKNEDNK
jgi:hypothetical protein